MSCQKILSIEDDVAVQTNVLLCFAMIVTVTGQGTSSCVGSAACVAGKHSSGCGEKCRSNECDPR